MKILYKNTSQKEITKEQIIPNSGYYKITKDDNGKIIREEYYSDEKLICTYFYVDLGSSHQEILDLKIEGSIVFIEIEKINEYYSKHHLYAYKNKIVTEKDFSIYDNNGFCFMVQDLETNIKTRLETNKYYKDPKSGYEFEFDYSDLGKLMSIEVSNNSPFFHEPFRSDELGLIPNFEWWEKYSSYYLNAEPAVPKYVIETK